jgi:O-antigen ligase
MQDASAAESRTVPEPLLAQALVLAALLAFWWRSPSAWPAWAWLPDLLLVVATAFMVRVVGLAPKLGAPFLAAAALVVASNLAASDAHAALTSAAGWARLVLAAMAAASWAASARADSSGASLRRMAWVLAAAGVGMTLDGALQVLIIHPALARQEGLSAGMVGQLLDARANAVFLLPAHLGGFLAASLVASAGLAADALMASRGGRSGARSAMPVALAPACACLAGLALAGSMGGALLAGLALAIFAVLGLSGRGRVVVVLAALVVVVGLFGTSRLRRHAEIAREDPGVARSLNWATAARIIRQAPLLGHGGGSFSFEHARERRAAENETAHAHQGYLEAAAENGVAMLPLLAILLAAVVRAALLSRGILDASLAAAAVALLAHAFIDFGWSDPAWGVPAALVVGFVLGRSVPRARPVGSRAVLIVAAIGLVVLASSIPRSFAATWAERAFAAGEAGDHASALALLGRARRADPLNARLAAARAAASMALAATSSEEARRHLLDDAAREAGEAAMLSPRSAAHRILWAHALVAQGRRFEALTQASRAAQLAPHRADALALREQLLPRADAASAAEPGAGR